MTQQNFEPSLSSVARQLDILDATLTLSARRSRSRNFWLLVLSVLTIIFLVFYLGYAYDRYGGDVTPDLVAANAEIMFENQLPNAREQLETNLKANAPDYVNKMVDQLKTMPAKYADQLNQEASDRIDKAMPEVGDSLYSSMKAELENARQKPGGGTDEQRFQATLTAVGQVYSDETLKLVNQAHATYATEAVDFTNYLEVLANNQALDHREQLHREMFRDMLLLMRERAKDSGKDDQMNVNMLQPAQ